MPQLPGMDPLAATAMVGMVDLAMAERVLSLVPEDLHQAVLEPEGAAVVCLALLLDPRERLRDSQLAVLEARLGTAASDRIAQAAGHLSDLGQTVRLALLDLATPALHHLPEARRDDLQLLVQRLVEIDGIVSPAEAALAAAIESRLRPEERGKPDPAGALAVLAMLAHAGHDDEAEAEEAWRKGAEVLASGGFALPAPLPSFGAVVPAAGAESAAHAARLAAMKERYRQCLLQAMAEVASHDGVIRPKELELLRSTAAALGCPMPPLDV
jgi:uncharacterized tellurite resistance protein B-like protein